MKLFDPYFCNKQKERKILIHFWRFIIFTENWSKFDKGMSGCLENCRMPNMEWLEIENRRNLLASIISGILVSKKKLQYGICLEWHFMNYFQFFGGWWFAIDAAANYTDKTSEMKDVFHICGVFGTLSFFMWVISGGGNLLCDTNESCKLISQNIFFYTALQCTSRSSLKIFTFHAHIMIYANFPSFF